MAIPKNIIAPPRTGPVTQRKSGSGFHDSRPRGQRDRAGARRAALSEQGA